MIMNSNKDNIILNKSFEFALKIIDFCELLEENKKFIVARQLLRSGTSIGANVREAQNAESKIDFVHKIKIAAKEADETEYWLLLCKESKSYPENPGLLFEIREIMKILAKIIITSKS
jgi:four helix bundle protein